MACTLTRSVPAPNSISSFGQDVGRQGLDARFTGKKVGRDTPFLDTSVQGVNPTTAATVTVLTGKGTVTGLPAPLTLSVEYLFLYKETRRFQKEPPVCRWAQSNTQITALSLTTKSMGLQAHRWPVLSTVQGAPGHRVSDKAITAWLPCYVFAPKHLGSHRSGLHPITDRFHLCDHLPATQPLWAF